MDHARHAREASTAQEQQQLPRPRAKAVLPIPIQALEVVSARVSKATRDLMASASSARIRPTRRQSVQPTAVSAQRTRGTRIARVRRAYATRDSEAAAVVRRIQSALSVVRVPTRPQREMQVVCLARPESGRM